LLTMDTIFVLHFLNKASVPNRSGANQANHIVNGAKSGVQTHTQFTHTHTRTHPHIPHTYTHTSNHVAWPTGAAMAG